ncbi:proton-conducting transporter membrane subunit [Kamptonema cortianum]|nr:proton-conducting transporter membrane subunit [Geitlerinema splendidum]MDK3158492.1 proton-conducting transporter membrane subunit [Kamptonema cortianum]
MSIILVVLIPLAMAAVLLTLWTRPQYRKRAALAGCVAHLASGSWLVYDVFSRGVQSYNVSAWIAPYGIELVADELSAILVLVTGIIGVTTTVYSFHNIDAPRRAYGFHPLFFVLIAGLSGAFVTGDLFNLFVWFECILLSSFVLLSLGGEKDQIRGALNYVVPNLFSSMLFLTGLGLLYGATGTLNLDDLSLKVPLVEPAVMQLIALVFLVAFGVKAAFFPFFSWLPTSYHTPPTSVTALFAGLLTKVGIYAIIRFFTKVYTADSLLGLILAASILTMIVGMVGAIAQTDLRKILAYNLMGHIGFMTLGLAMADRLAMTSSILYMVHHMLIISALFFLTGIVEFHTGSTKLAELGGLLRSHPTLSIAMFVGLLSLAGIPPLSGFWPKFGLMQASVAAENWLVLVAIIITSLLTLVSVSQIWIRVFWGQKPESSSEWPEPVYAHSKYGPVIALLGIAVLIGLFPAVPARAAENAADRLMYQMPQESNR